MKKRIIPILLAALLLAGCHQKHADAFPVVTKIEVMRENTGHRQIYIHDAQMRPILNALRLIGHRHRPERDPETLDLPAWSVTVTHSDGSAQKYRIKADLYIQEGRGPWQQADPERLEALTALLEASL